MTQPTAEITPLRPSDLVECAYQMWSTKPRMNTLEIASALGVEEYVIYNALAARAGTLERTDGRPPLVET